MTSLSEQIEVISVTLSEFRKETNEELSRMRDCLTHLKVGFAKMEEHVNQNSEEIRRMKKDKEKNHDRQINFNLAVIISIISALCAVLLEKVIK